MPTYEYTCDKCGHRFEKFQSMTARPVKNCPQCKKASARRVITSGAGVIFKGSGFYQTDYRSKSYTEAAKKEAESKSPPPSPAPEKTAKNPPAKKEKE
jgi:putative FmdB family regulatory protein